MDAAGNLYIADTGNTRIRKVTPAGIITTIAGSTAGFAGDGGPATEAQLSSPRKAVATANGEVYIADSANNRIRKISAAGVLTTVAGTGDPGFSGDGDNAIGAKLSFPTDVATGANGAIYIADTNNSRIRQVNSQNRVDTIAGSGFFGNTGDNGPATRASFEFPRGIAVDAGGNVYVADTLNNRIRKISIDGTVTTIAGGNSAGYAGDGGQAGFSLLYRPTSAAVDARGNVYFADTGNHRIRRITPQGTINTIAGNGTNGFRGDRGPATAAQLNSPQSIAVDAAGNVYIADTDNHRIRKVDTQGTITTVAGSDPGGGDGGQSTAARLFQPSGVAVDSTGAVYVSDTANSRVRRIAPDGTVSTVAGTGAAGYAGDKGVATSAQLNNPNGLALDRSGSLYIADTGNHAIRKVAGGIISTVVGTGVSGNSGDFGPAAEATLFNPNAVAFDIGGRMYVADSANNRVRVVTNGTIQHFAGDPKGLPGFAGDGGPAGAASFDYPIALAIEAAGNVYVSDYFNNRVRRISSSGGISTFAGTGKRGNSGDGGPAVNAQFALPAGLAFDADRNLLVADLLNNRIRAINTGGVVHAIAGFGGFGDSGDGGPALLASLASPRDLAVDSKGSIYFSDQDNNQVRKLVQSSVTIKTIVNAASGIAGPVAPGEFVAIFGTQLGARVLFDGVPAPILYYSTTQINAVVPNEVAGKQSVQLRIENATFGATEFTLSVREAVPGLFTVDSTGSGQASAINEDGSMNGTSNPAARDSIVALYGTGQGFINGTATVRIQGQLAEVLYAGPAPGTIGLFQVNARVPGSTAPGPKVPIEVVFGSFAAQQGVTIAVN